MTVSYSEMLRCFGRIGLMSFGGPAAQISLMQTELVERKAWLSQDQFLGALSFCMLLPGPEAMQLATYAGWRLRGTLGGLMAGLLFVLPGALVIFALAFGYAFYGQLPWVQAVFLGVKAAVVVIVLHALISLSRRALKGPLDWALAGAGFVAMFALSVPFPLVIALAAVIGFLTSTGTAAAQAPRPPSTPRWPQTLRTIATWGALWAAPVVLVLALDRSFLGELAVFFSTLAVVTFGGAYAVLAYMAQAVVDTNGWLTTQQMIDALGLAETTPGPLILVTQFVGALAGYLQGGIWLAVAAGMITLWVTFVPCFLWIFAGAPYVDDLLARPRLKRTLSSISAAVVGVILNLSVWFALHVLFETVHPGAFVPRAQGLMLDSAALIAGGALAHFGLRMGMIKTLILLATLAGAMHLIA